MSRDFSKEEELKFIKGLYDRANLKIKDVYKEQKKNKDELLKDIANIMLIYVIKNNKMNISTGDKIKLKNKLYKKIDVMLKNEINITENTIDEIMRDTIKDTFSFYKYEAEEKEIDEIVNRDYKDKNFKQRIKDNSNNIGIVLKANVYNFICGELDVNHIKNKIDNIYNSNANNVIRLTETEVNRCENDGFIMFCMDNNIKLVVRNEELDERTCDICESIDGQIYTLIDAPDAIHPRCRGFNTII